MKNECKLQGAGCKKHGAWRREQGAWCMVHGEGSREQGAGCMVYGERTERKGLGLKGIAIVINNKQVIQSIGASHPEGAKPAFITFHRLLKVCRERSAAAAE